MTDLSTKVTQITNRQDATNTKLDALLAALGAPPPTATVTLADVLAAIQTTNTKLDALAGYLSTIATQTNLTRVTLDAWVDDWYSGVGGLQYLENIQFGLQDVRRAILSTACACTGENPLLPAPGGTTPYPTDAEQEKCKRAQKFVDWFLQEILIRVRDIYATYGFVGAAVIGALLSAALVALAPETAGTSLIPAVAIAALVSLIGSISSTQIGQIVTYYNTSVVKNALIQAIYTADTAQQAKANFDAAFDAFSDIPTPIKAIWRALALQIFFDQTFDPARAIDTTGYDGTACFTVSQQCYTFGSRLVTVDTVEPEGFDGTAQAIEAAPPGMSMISQIGVVNVTINYSPAYWVVGNVSGWTLQVLTGTARFLYRNTPTNAFQDFSTLGPFTPSSGIITLPTTNHWTIDDAAQYGPFTVRICRP